MPNETPKSKCCNADIFVTTKGYGFCESCLDEIYAPTSAGSPAKQHDDMPDVIYASEGVGLNATHSEHIDSTPYIRKSIHDRKIEEVELECSEWQNNAVVKEQQITALKLKLKECVETLESIVKAGISSQEMQQAITSAKELL